MNYLKKMLPLLGALSSILTIWIISMGFSGGGSYTMNILPVFASPTGYTGSFITNPTFGILEANNHVSNYFDDPEYLTTNQYNGNNYMYAQYGGALEQVNCTDIDQGLANIQTSNGITGFMFAVDVNTPGDVWLQYVSQCHDDFTGSNEFGDGIYFKGSRNYGAGDFPTTPEDSDILIDMVIETSCRFPWFITPGASQYGCGGTGDVWDSQG